MALVALPDFRGQSQPLAMKERRPKNIKLTFFNIFNSSFKSNFLFFINHQFKVVLKGQLKIPMYLRTATSLLVRFNYLPNAHKHSIFSSTIIHWIILFEP